MCQVKEKNREINYYKNIENFLPYFYHDTIKGNTELSGVSGEELLEMYNNDINFKEWIDKEFIIANEQLSVRQRNNVITLWTDPALEESRRRVLEALLKGCVLGGKKGGAKNVESGHIKALGEKWGGINYTNMAREIFTCSVCGYTGRGRPNRSQHHEENCKLPLMEKMFALLPNHFTRNSAKEILKRNNIKPSLVDKLTFKDPTYSNWTFKSYEGTKDHSYDVPVYSKSFDINELEKITVSEIVKNNIKLGNERVIAHNNNNKKICGFCNTTQSAGNYIKNGHDIGRCVLPKVKKKTEYQLKKEHDIDNIISFFKDFGWINLKETKKYDKLLKKLNIIKTPKSIGNLFSKLDQFKYEISIQPSPAGPRKTKMWIYKQ